MEGVAKFHQVIGGGCLVKDWTDRKKGAEKEGSTSSSFLLPAFFCQSFLGRNGIENVVMLKVRFLGLFQQFVIESIDFQPAEVWLMRPSLREERVQAGSIIAVSHLSEMTCTKCVPANRD